MVCVRRGAQRFRPTRRAKVGQLVVFVFDFVSHATPPISAASTAEEKKVDCDPA
jgi:hypothetical protein